MHLFTSTRQPQSTAHVQIGSAAELAAALPRTGLCDGTVCGRSPDCARKAASPGYCMAELPGGRRAKAGATSEWLTLDIDAPDVPAELRAYERVEVPTHSGHWHVLVRLERAASPDEYAATIAQWPCADARARDVSRYLYAPHARAAVRAYDGKRLAVEQAAPKALADWTPPANKQLPTRAMWDSYVARYLGRAQGTNALAGAIGGALRRKGWELADIEGALRDRLTTDPKLDKHVDDALRAAASVDAGEPSPGLPTLSKLGVLVEFEATEPSAAEPIADDEYARTIVRLSDLPELPPLEYVCAPLLIARGVRPTAIACYPGVGKTHAGIELARAVAYGDLAYGHFPVAAGRALFVANEGMRGARDALQRVVRGSAREAVSFAVNPLILAGAGAERAFSIIERACAEYDLVVFDALGSTLAGDENTAAYADPLGRLERIASSSKAAVVLLRHARKTQAGQSAEQAGRGSSAIDGRMSAQWQLKPRGRLGEAGRAVEWQCTRANDTDRAPSPPFIVRLQADGSFVTTLAQAEGEGESDDVELAGLVASLPPGLSAWKLKRELRERGVHGRFQAVWSAYKGLGTATVD